MKQLAELRMEDFGTRMDHLTDVKDIWEEALRIMNARSRTYETPDEHKEKQKLVAALEMLNTHMQKDYNEFDYRREINTLKRPEEI